MNTKDQQTAILNYINTHKTITVRQAFYLGINSPTKRISELRQDGKPIIDKWENGENGRYKVYSLEV